MNGEAKKLQLIEKLLQVSDDAVLAEVEAVLTGEKIRERKSFESFAGKIGENELTELEQIIEQGCEQINEDDWK